MVENSILERRSSIRVEDSIPAEAHFINGQVIQQAATIENICEGGACLMVNIEKDKIKKEVYLKIKFPGDLSYLEIAATVVWKRQGRLGSVSIGLKFSNLPLTVKNNINKYVQSRIQQLSSRIIKKIAFKRLSLNKLSEKERRNLIILDAIRKRGPISKAQLSQIADLNIGSITNYIEDYIKKELVLEMGLDVSTGGRRPTLLELNPQYGLCIGVDISNKKKGLVIVICDVKGKVINKDTLSLRSNNFRLNSLIERIYEMMSFSCLPTSSILGIGIVVNGDNYREPLDLKYALEQEFNISVLIEDASCANLFAERMIGPSLDDSEKVLYFSVANSECAFIINGDICRINSRFAINDRNGKNPLRNMCWRLEESCLLHPLPQYNPKNIKALPWDLGLRLAILTNILNPDLIIVGGLEKKEMFRDLLTQVREHIKQWLVNEKVGLPTLILEHFGDEAAALGAALLVSREVFIQA